MLIPQARALTPGTRLLTTDGVRVTFVELGSADVTPTRTKNPAGPKPRKTTVAVVELADGTRRMVPPRSLHPERTAR